VGLIDVIGSTFYEPIDGRSRPVLGQIVWAPVPNLNPQPHVIEPRRLVSTSHATAAASFVPMNDTHFTRASNNALPILNVRLGETEELLAYKAKKRPAVVVGVGATKLGGLGDETKPHHEEDRLVIAPIYGIRSEDDPSGFGPILAARIDCLMYRQFFPIAPYTERRRDRPPNSCNLEIGVARLDRLQFVRPASPGCCPAPLKLSRDALPLLHAAVWAYLHAAPDQELTGMRDLLAGTLPDEARPLTN
jgi:hypothetical protein